MRTLLLSSTPGDHHQSRKDPDAKRGQEKTQRQNDGETPRAEAGEVNPE
jgi:hypothetical protein